ncbi:MAG: nascent polypeptide-associated complex protein [Thermoplasmata archaeon]|nr:nascent polypeptide-associated complex protein [Thermoplasmata archaeon]
MIPGGRMNPRQMQLMMKRMGLTSEPISGVEEVIVRTATEEHHFRKPEVTILTVQGVKTYQIVGEPEVRPRGACAPAEKAPSTAPTAPAAAAGPPEEDVELVISQTGVDRPTAISALRDAHGEPAEAILQLLSRRGPGGG